MGDFQGKARLLAWAVRWSTFRRRLAWNVWACWSMNMFVVWEKREKSRGKKSKEDHKRDEKEVKRKKAHFAKDVRGGT